MIDCDHVKLRKLSSFFPWIEPRDDKEVRCYNKDEADNCSNCKEIKENHGT
jgi:hypothetical protein